MARPGDEVKFRIDLAGLDRDVKAAERSVSELRRDTKTLKSQSAKVRGLTRRLRVQKQSLTKTSVIAQGLARLLRRGR